MKVLAVLVNYGNEQLEYLQTVVDNLKLFKKYNVTVIVNSSIPLDKINGIDHVNVVQLDNYQLLPMTCREVLWHYREDFDVFLYGENDHLFEEKHIGRLYPAYHANYGWDYDSVEEFNGKKFAHFTNVHQATLILTREQLLKIGNMHTFTQFFGESHYSAKCKVNTDVYQFCGMKKMICISELKDNSIHHLPNIYIKGDKGRDSLGSSEETMQKDMKRML